MHGVLTRLICRFFQRSPFPATRSVQIQNLHLTASAPTQLCLHTMGQWLSTVHTTCTRAVHLQWPPTVKCKTVWLQIYSATPQYRSEPSTSCACTANHFDRHIILLGRCGGGRQSVQPRSHDPALHLPHPACAEIASALPHPCPSSSYES